MKSLFVLFLFLISCNLYSNRIFIWIPDFSNQYNLNESFEELVSQTESVVLNYSSQGSLNSITNELYIKFLKPVEMNNSFVIIGFGVGGLIARNLKFNLKNIESIITVATPNAGTQLLRNIYDGKSYDFFSYVRHMSMRAFNETSQLNEYFRELSFDRIISAAEMPLHEYNLRAINNSLISMSGMIESEVTKYLSNGVLSRDVLPYSYFLQSINTGLKTVKHYNIYIDDAGNNSKETTHALALINQIELGCRFASSTLSDINPAISDISMLKESIYSVCHNWENIFQYLYCGIHLDIAKSIGAINYGLIDVGPSLCVKESNEYSKMIYFPFITGNDGFLSSKEVVDFGNDLKSIKHIKLSGLNHFNLHDNQELKCLLEDIVIKNFLNLQ